jgi:hypothetical protein
LIGYISAVTKDILTNTDEKTRKERFESQNWEAIKDNLLYDIIMEYKCNFPDEPPAELPQDNGIRHEYGIRYEIDLIPGTKY